MVFFLVSVTCVFIALCWCVWASTRNEIPMVLHILGAAVLFLCVAGLRHILLKM